MQSIKQGLSENDVIRILFDKLQDSYSVMGKR